jgi:hypothetical protein
MAHLGKADIGLGGQNSEVKAQPPFPLFWLLACKQDVQGIPES